MPPVELRRTGTRRFRRRGSLPQVVLSISALGRASIGLCRGSSAKSKSEGPWELARLDRAEKVDFHRNRIR